MLTFDHYFLYFKIRLIVLFQNLLSLRFLSSILPLLFFLTHTHAHILSFSLSIIYITKYYFLPPISYLLSILQIDRHLSFFFMQHVTYPFLINEHREYVHPCRPYCENKNVVESGQSERSSLSACRSMRNTTVPTCTACQRFVGGPNPTRLPGSRETPVVQSRHCDEYSRHDILYWKPDTTFR